MIKTTRTIFYLLCFLGLGLPSMAEQVADKNSQGVVNRGYQSIPEARFLKNFEKYLYRQLRTKGSDVVVSRFKAIGNRPVPAGEVSLQLFQKNKRRLQGNVKLIAAIKVNGVEKNRVMLSGWVDIFESVVCTSRNLKRGEIIKKDDVYLAQRNISRLSPKVLTRIDKAEGLRTKHNIMADTCIKEWMLEKTPAVERGDIVTILAESGYLKVTVPGRVLMKGCTGELIKVQNLMSKKDIYAKVVNNTTVMVNY